MNTSFRQYTLIDQFCLHCDQVLKVLTNQPVRTGSPYPAQGIEEATLDDEARKHAAALMRINHAGEICAQALYQGQYLVSRKESVQEKLLQAAKEEGDHLAWCKRRIDELGSHPSYLNPFWYTGSFCIGMIAGMVGDQWSLGFVAETERQVVKHLTGQIHLLPKEDKRSYTILKQMEKEEDGHRKEAIQLGAHDLPHFVKTIMRLSSKCMIKISYWI